MQTAVIASYMIAPNHRCRMVLQGCNKDWL